MDNITFKQFFKWCFTPRFYSFVKKMGKRKKDNTFLMRKKGEKQNSATIMIFADGKGTVFFSEVEITGGRSNKDIKKREF